MAVEIPATSENIPGTLVLRDASGNLSAGQITADVTGDLTGNVTGNLTGNVTGDLTGNLIGSAAQGASGDAVFYENDQTVTANYTITTNKNAMSAGPITVNNGVIVTVPNGSTWTIV